MKGKKTILLKTSRFFFGSESIGESFSNQSLKRALPQLMQSGQKAVLRRRFWESRNKSFCSAHFGSTYPKIIMIQRLVWHLPKDNMHICEAFHIFLKLHKFEDQNSLHELS